MTAILFVCLGMFITGVVLYVVGKNLQHNAERQLAEYEAEQHHT